MVLGGLDAVFGAIGQTESGRWVADKARSAVAAARSLGQAAPEDEAVLDEEAVLDATPRSRQRVQHRQ